MSKQLPKTKSAKTPGPTLFGLEGKTNRQSKHKTFWGKNEFNSSFPTSLLCYMSKKKVKPIYLKLDRQLNVVHKSLTVHELFRKDPLSPDIYFSFEDGYSPYQSLVRGQLPKDDLVIRDIANGSQALAGFEVKLTGLPDSSTAKLGEGKYSCEIVIRPPSIAHLAMSIAYVVRNDRQKLMDALSPVCSKIFNWRSPEEILHHTDELVSSLDNVLLEVLDSQEPFIIQPIWKSVGKASVLHKNCLDVFIWSNFAFTRLFIDEYRQTGTTAGQKSKKATKPKMTRPQRTIFWLGRMLYDFAQSGQIDYTLITSEMGYKLQTDKAFSINGMRSRKYLDDPVLRKPRIKSTEIKNIILNGGQDMLSPERRFDAAIVNTQGIFK